MNNSDKKAIIKENLINRANKYGQAVKIIKYTLKMMNDTRVELPVKRETILRKEINKFLEDEIN
tara:strand:+ start:1294 stop:1485 length:192 start_codon:yes stop_codon:yes gene_type:complete